METNAGRAVLKKDIDALRMFSVATWRLVRRRTRRRCIKAFLKWRAVSNVTVAVDMCQRQVARRTKLLDVLQKAYWKDIVATREYLAQNESVLSDAPMILKSIPSLNFENQYLSINEAEAVRRRLEMSQIIPLAERLEYGAAGDVMARNCLELGDEMEDYSFVVRSCDKCQGVAQFVASRNERVAKALRYMNRKVRRDKKLDEAREHAAEQLQRLQQLEVQVHELQYELHVAKAQVGDEQQKLASNNQANVWLLDQVQLGLGCATYSGGGRSCVHGSDTYNYSG